MVNTVVPMFRALPYLLRDPLRHLRALLAWHILADLSGNLLRYLHRNTVAAFSGDLNDKLVCP